MKSHYLIVVFFIAVLTVIVVESAESDDLEKLITEKAKMCQKENNATDGDYNDLMEGKEATTKIAKCMLACLLKKLGIMSKDNKLVPEKYAEMVDGTLTTKDGKPLKSVLKDMLDACKSVSDTDECTAASNIIACLNAEAKKYGFDKNVF